VKRLALALLFLIPLAALAIPEPRTMRGANNFAWDARGVVDTRPGCWGTADAHTFPVTFRPPAGYRVRITRAYGDFVAWPRGVPPPGTFAGVLFGLQDTGPDGSRRADWLADNTMLYVQGAVGQMRERMAFDVRIKDGALGPDHKLLYKFAVWLNDTGLIIHMEASVTLEYVFERAE
jgi:hypothetical protein